MKFQITINSIQTVEQLENFWTDQDHVLLLEKFDYPDADKADKETLTELLLMAITDFEPPEAAAILLEYKLADRLNDAQIQQISHDMLVDKISEEYPEIDLHAPLFHINQLLFKAYNGTFPSAKASVIECSIESESASDIEITKEIFLRLLNDGLSDRNVIKRLFEEQMEGQTPFPEADAIIWELTNSDTTHYRMVTSSYWIDEQDVIASAFEGSVEKVLSEE